MNNLRFNILIIFLLFPLCLFSQTDTSITALQGFEDAGGTTHLFYNTKYSNLNESVDTSLFNIYHLNTSNLSDSIFLSGKKIRNMITVPPTGDISGSVISSVNFFNNDPAQYIYIQKSGISLSNNKIIKSDIGEVFSTTKDIRLLYISKQDSNNVYAILDGLILKSTDGGNSWPSLSDSNFILTDFTVIKFSPFNENIIFGFNSNNQLVKSFDGGRNSLIVHPESIWDENSQICFDVNQENIYAVAGSENYFQLMDSHNQGNSYTWDNLAWFNGRIALKADEENSGSFYYINGYNIFYSSDYGLTRDTLFNLTSIPIDFYKVKGQNNFYVAYLNRIEKLSESYTQNLRNFSINNTLSLYPLNVGDKWIYHVTGYFIDVFPVPIDGYNIVEVTTDTVITNHIYYRIDKNEYFYNNWTRIDSITGQIRELYTNSNSEISYLDLLSPNHASFEVTYAQVEDVVISDTTLWGKWRMRKHFDFSSLSVITQEYAQGIGLIYQTDGFDFGETTSVLQGCVINGVVYGDTTLVVGIKEDNLSLPKEYKLYQNYPNPFNPSTVIKYAIPAEQTEYMNVQLKIYDILGREVAVLVNKKQNPGNYQVTFSADNLPSGVYIYRLTANSFSTSKKMILLR